MEITVGAAWVGRSTPGDHRFSLSFAKDIGEIVSKVGKLLSVSRMPRGARAREMSRFLGERERDVRFDTSWLEDLAEKTVIEIRCEEVAPLVSNPGRMLLTNARLYFQPFNNVGAVAVRKYRLDQIAHLYRRRHMLRHTGLEVIMNDGTTLYLAFSERGERDEAHALICAQPAAKAAAAPDQATAVLLKWQNGLVSNFDYLMHLNHLSDRSFNDIAQYPVFPHVIADYSSSTLDLSNPATFRDLSKPIGALNPKRLEGFKARYEEMPEPKFLYGTHYSTPGYVLFYLVRQRPDLMLKLQSGKFDAPDRLFASVAELWDSVTNNPGDVKELIPEFFMPPAEFLENLDGLDLGVRQNGRRVGDVELPPWAKGSAREFARLQREALESDWVSAHLHLWIDLIFGCKQRGDAAREADNLFYHLTYEGAVDLDAETDPERRAGLEAQIQEFGQTPSQIFTTPHPQRLPKEERRANVDLTRLPVVGLASSSSTTSKSGASLLSPAAGARAETAAAAGGAASAAPGPRKEWPHAAAFGGMTVLGSARLHRGEVTGCSLSPDSKTVYTVGADSCLKSTSIDGLKQQRSIALGTLALSGCAVTPDGRTVLAGSWDNRLYMYAAETGRVLDAVHAHDDAVSTVLVRGDVAFSGSWDTSIKMWKVRDGSDGPDRTPYSELNNEHEAEVRCLDADLKADIAVSGANDGNVIVWKVSQSRALRTLQVEDDGTPVTGVRLTPDCKRVICVGSESQRVSCHDLSSGAQIFSANAGEPLHAVESDGRAILCAAESGNILIYNLAGDGSLAASLTFPGPKPSPARCLAVTMGANHVIAGHADGTMTVWGWEGRSVE